MATLIYHTTLADEGLPVRRIAFSRLHMSYGQFKRAKFEGEIRLEGQMVHANELVREGQTLSIFIPEPPPTAIEPYFIPLSIPYRSDDFLVIDKPAPLPSTSSPHQDTITLENAIYANLGCPKDFVYRPINRLDKGTSGLMLVALHAHAQQRLQFMLHTPDFTREYLAVCEGCPPTAKGTIDLPIAKEDGASIRREIRADGKPAKTHYQLLKTAQNRCLLRLRLETGRTHQIRVHLKALGCPVVGDFLYGREHPLLPGRFALHSHYVRLSNPFSNKPLTIESPLPDLLLKALGE